MTKAFTHSQTVPNDGFEIDLRVLFFILRERFWTILLVTLLAVAGAFVYLARTPKLFVASATVEIDREVPTFLEVKVSEASAVDTAEAVKTIEAKLNTSALMRRLARNPELEVTPEKFGLPPSATPEALAYRLREMLSVGLIRGTRLIGVAATHTDPDFAARIANGVVDGYIGQLSEERAEIAQQANSYLNGEASRLKQKLRESERALQKYREESQSVSLEEKQIIVVAQLQDLNQKLTQARAERMKLAATLEQGSDWKQKAPEQILSVAAVASSPGVMELQKRIGELNAEVANLQQRYLPEHPRLIQARSQLEQSKSELDKAVVHAMEGMNLALDIATKTEASYAAAVAEQEKKALAQNKSAIDYKALERDVESDRAMFVSVLQRLQESDLTKSLNQGVVRLIEAAVPPERPAKPRAKLILAGAAAAGLLAGILLALLLNAFDPSLKTVDQTERALCTHVLAAVPRGFRRSGGRALVDADEGLLAEAFRTLRTALALNDESSRTILFTSATENDGKTFCAINCAAALARAGSRTLLIDADLRKPSIGSAFFLGESNAGLSEVLRMRASLKDATQETSVPNLFVLTAGQAIYDPSELLHGHLFADFIAAAAANHDYIVVDSAPLQAVSDGLLLAKAIKTVCFVLRAGETHRRAAVKACETLLDAGVSLAGIVLNRVSRNSRGFYYHYQSGCYGKDVYGASGKRGAWLKDGERA